MTTGKFDGDAFFAALDAERQSRRMTWKKVAEQARVPASTLTRMSQGKRPDADTLAALCAWSGLKSENFIKVEGGAIPQPQPLSMVTALFRADPNLTPEGAKALEVLVKTAYEQLRKP